MIAFVILLQVQVYRCDSVSTITRSSSRALLDNESKQTVNAALKGIVEWHLLSWHFILILKDSKEQF